MERSGEGLSRAQAAGEWLTEALPDLVAECGVVGAQAAVLVDGEIVDAAAGVLNLTTCARATPDAMFQIGSITKVWTATLVVQLVNEGLVDLDRPVCEYLDGFRLADQVAGKTVTPRQLLSHTGGFDGDLWTDTGRNEDVLQKYVETLSSAAQFSAPGERFSYCNSGYVVLGRLVEVLRGKPYNTVLRERLVDPLGLADVATCIEEAILGRPAVGHERARPDAPLERVKKWSLVPSTAPAGAMLAMSARDLLGFVRHHLSTDQYDAMREPHAEVAEPGLIDGHWGLGWSIPDYGGPVVLGHSGHTMGQRAFLRVVPAAGVAVALLTNGGDVYPMFSRVFDHLLHELAGLRQPSLPVPPASPRPVDARRAAGTYRCSLGDWVVRVDADGRTWLRVLLKSRSSEQDDEAELVALNDDALITLVPQEGRHEIYGLGDADAAGRAKFLRYSGRVFVRDDLIGAAEPISASSAAGAP
ncbi:CubicO group peptidase, beta-lactamase class C family [Lentzea xinjiangensis]|uniref:CubicO group peptidase, beta-lactamase class C family n=1 Tax=Lentzea xinjiangensis TaxID=402600 RepID=A0A1H9W2T4_9PSEU|nr:serine hydrolase domain-containing protein [Lentzea xinjiangensis]SES28215.1 CubicO group peptidase, beta-lactamase class C family [Lentzea xinjiangensis]